ncbi:MAG: tRNA-uridine aminocarboxypropyltransferase [Polyangiales bacterium]
MRTKRLPRCPTCGLSPNLCVCASLPKLAPRTRIVVVAHRVELGKTTNTGRLVAHMLGDHAELTTADTQPPPLASAGTWVLFPSDDAVPLDEVHERIDTLVVPDGTWPQARRIIRRHPYCVDRRRVRLVSPPPSRYQLRRYRDPASLCTLESVAYALRAIEGEHGAAVLLAAFEAWQERAIRVRQGAHEQRDACLLGFAEPDAKPTEGC